MSGVDIAGLVGRVGAYLSNGGLFNPELADHDAVRGLVVECRDALLAQAAELAEAQGEVERLADKLTRKTAECDVWRVEAEDLKALDANAEWTRLDELLSEEIEARETATRQRDEVLAALKASEERGEREGALGWNSEAEWEIEQRAFHAAGRADVPKDVQELVAILWKQYCIAAEPLENSKAPLADATNNPPSDPGTEQREAGV